MKKRETTYFFGRSKETLRDSKSPYIIYRKLCKNSNSTISISLAGNPLRSSS